MTAVQTWKRLFERIALRGDSQQMPVQPGPIAKQRMREKTALVLRFLSMVTYSNSVVLGEVMGCRERTAIYKALSRMQKENLIRYQPSSVFGGITSLWGITTNGQQESLQDGEELNPNTVFNSSKVSLPMLRHYLAMQLVHVKALKAGWSGFEYCDRERLEFASQTKKDKTKSTRPDMLATHPEGYRVAIEVERTLKPEFRYREQVLPRHVKNLNAKQYDAVLWLCLTPEHQLTLNKRIKKLMLEMRDRHTWYLDIPAANYKTFQFANLDTWPNY
jgi:hypothetical protein